MFAFDTVLLESTTVDKRSQIKNYLRGVTSRTFDPKGMPHPPVLNFVYRVHFSRSRDLQVPFAVEVYLCPLGGSCDPKGLNTKRPPRSRIAALVVTVRRSECHAAVSRTRMARAFLTPSLPNQWSCKSEFLHDTLVNRLC